MASRSMGTREAKITPASQEEKEGSKVTKSTPASIRAVLGLGFGAPAPY